ncbi:MAG: hypothetical protein KC422_10205 [Trueperaceae bacterium]|nr:hypothetical protein [Trueperaceae bacterium]
MKRTLFGLSLLACLLLISCQQASLIAPLPAVVDEVPEGSEALPQKPSRLELDHNATKVQQVYNWPGLGFDSNHEDPKGSCLEEVLLSPMVGQKRMELSFTMAESHDELVKYFGLEGHVGFNWGFIKGSGSLEYVNDHEADNYSLYLIMKASLNTQTLSVNQASLSSEAETLLNTKGYESLVQKCGDQFVSSITLGGSYYAVFRIVASSYKQKEEFKATIRIKILFVHITIHIHEVMSDIYRKAKDMSFVVFQTPNLIPTLRSGDFSLVQDTASFIYEAQDYLSRLEQHCEIQLLNGQYQYPVDCVSVITLQDYLTLTPYTPDPDIRARQHDALLIKTHLQALGARLKGLEHDLFFVTAQPYFFIGLDDAARRDLFAERYQTVKAMQTSLENDLEYCTSSLANVILARCQAYVSAASGTTYATLKAQLSDWQSSLPDRQDADVLPKSCQEVHSFGVLNLYQENTLYFQGASGAPYTVLCYPSFSSDLIFEEYLRVPQEDEYAAAFAATLQGEDSFVDGLDPLDMRANLVRFDHKGRVQTTRWQLYRINPVDLTIDINNLRFAETVGYAGATEFGLDYSQGMPVSALYACSSTRPMRLFSYISLLGTDLVIDPLMLGSSVWQEQFKRGSAAPGFVPEGRLERAIEVAGTQFALMARLEPNECISAVPQTFRLMPRSSLVSY